MKIINEYGTVVSDANGGVVSTKLNRQEWLRFWDIMKEFGYKNKSEYLRKLVRADIAKYEFEWLLAATVTDMLVEPMGADWTERLKGLIRELPENQRNRINLKMKKL